MDIGTGLTAFGAAIGGKDLVIKILGPTADYVGEGIKDFTQKRIENVKKIFDNASKKLGKKLEEEKGFVSPKVLKGILDEGSYSSNNLSTDYFGGVLASSRSETLRDDRGAYFIALINRLSVYQLRLHYIFYYTVKKLFNGSDISPTDDKNNQYLKVNISFLTYIEAMDFSESEISELANLINHSIIGLTQEGLIHQEYSTGNYIYTDKDGRKVSQGGMILRPTGLGTELFLWACGLGKINIGYFLKENVIIKLNEEIVMSGLYKIADEA